MAKIICPPQSGRVGNVVFVQSARYGQLVRKYSIPRNPRTELQQANRSGFGTLATQWRGLPPEHLIQWNIAAVQHRTGLCGYTYFMKLNAARVHLRLSRLDLPPSQPPAFAPNPVGEVVVTGTGEQLSIKLPVTGQPAQYTLVEAAAPVSAGVRCVQAYRFVGLLPAPVNGWSDIAALYVARYGAPPPGTVIFIRTRQQIDGWNDVGKITSAMAPLA